MNELSIMELHNNNYQPKFLFCILVILAIIFGSSHPAPVQQNPKQIRVLLDSNPVLNNDTEFDFNPNDEDGPLSPSASQHFFKIHLNSTTFHQVTVYQQLELEAKNLTKQSDYFILIGLHSYRQNVSLCKREISRFSVRATAGPRILMNGTNFGFVIKQPTLQNSNSICLYNPNEDNLEVLIVATFYNNINPIPGGCNMEFPLEISPFIFAYRNNGQLMMNCLEFQPASLGNETNLKRMCGPLSRKLNYKIYAYYSHRRVSHDNDDKGGQNEYFSLLTSMSDPKWLTRQATLVRTLHQSRLLRIYFTANLDQQIYFNILISNGDSSKSSKSASTTNLQATLYVPSQIEFSHDWKEFIIHYPLLLLSSILLAIFSALVSIVGHRKFILEVFYFSFVLIVGLSLTLLSKHKSLTGSHLAILIHSVTFGTTIGLVWTLICRWSSNLKLALSVHSLVLSLWTVACLLDIGILLHQSCSIIIIQYFNLILALFGLLIHVGFIFSLDLFWLSALSTSVITVYFVLLPFDLFFNATLFRIALNIWLYNGFVSDTTFVNLTIFTVNDIITGIVFIFFVLCTIVWQLWSKIGNLEYGFACISPGNINCIDAAASQTSFSSSSRNSSNNNKKSHSSSIKSRKRKSSKGNKRRKIKIHHSSTSEPKPKPKLYRCKYCQKYSNSKQGRGHHSGPTSLSSSSSLNGRQNSIKRRGQRFRQRMSQN